MTKKLVLNLPSFGKGNWWVEITTNEPFCKYYFGPFEHPQEAENLRPGYVEDLEKEGAKEIKAVIKRCQPAKLTIFEEKNRVESDGQRTY